jgi:hypothetical protein
MPSSLNYLVLIVLVVLVYLLFRRPALGGSAGPVKGTDITGNPESALRKWDCSRDNRQLIFSDVPLGLTPYLVPFNETELRKEKLEDFKMLLSIAADVRFRDNESREIEKFEKPIKLWMSYNSQDLLALQNAGYTVDDLTPVKIVPGKTGWKRFDPKSVIYSNIKCGELGGVSITIDSWGDPPTGWGSPK